MLAQCLNRLCLLWVSLFLMAITSQVMASAYIDHPDYPAFAAQLKREYGVKEKTIRPLFEGLEKNQKVLDLMSKPAEKKLVWHQYRDIFLNDRLINQGLVFWKQHADLLKQASSDYQVPVEIIMAIIGVETRFGAIQGRFPVLQSLATLAFDYPRRSEFFTKELVTLVYLSQTKGLKLEGLNGSYAGAMGIPQFMPSSWLAYAVDFDQDGQIDLRNSPADAIGSVAHYLQQHGWILNDPVIVRAHVSQLDQVEAWVNKGLTPELTLDQWRKKGVTQSLQLPETELASLYGFRQSDDQVAYWLGLNNFYVITRYNRSRLYAMAVHELAMAFAEAVVSQMP